MSPSSLGRYGRDIESPVLSRGLCASRVADTGGEADGRRSAKPIDTAGNDCVYLISHNRRPVRRILSSQAEVCRTPLCYCFEQGRLEV